MLRDDVEQRPVSDARRNAGQVGIPNKWLTPTRTHRECITQSITKGDHGYARGRITIARDVYSKRVRAVLVLAAPVAVVRGPGNYREV